MSIIPPFRWKTPLDKLRTLGCVEGFSFLILVGIGMTLKYGFGIGGPNKVLGYIHGVLFIAYVGQLLLSIRPLRLSIRPIFILGIASLIPFGTFYTEATILSPLAEKQD